jgi:O-antigen ligase
MLLTVPYWLTIGTAQASVLRLGSLAALVTFVLGRRVRLCVTDYALALWVIIVVLGWLLQYDEPHAWQVVSVELTPLGFYLGARAIPVKRISLIIWVILGAGTVGAFTVLLEFALKHVIFLDPTTYVWNATATSVFRPGGIFGSPPAAANVLCFVVLLGISRLGEVQGRQKIAAVSCLSVCSLGLLVTLTRGDIVAAALGLVLFLWLTRSPLLRPVRIAWSAAAVALLVLLLLPQVQSSSLFQETVVRPGNFAARQAYWSLALPIVTSTPHNLTFGLGSTVLETPSIAVNAVVPSAVAGTPQLILNSLHNQYVTTLFEQGLIGLAALVAFLLSAILAAARSAWTSVNATAAALAASLVALAVIMFVDTALLDGPTFAMTMLCTGLIANLCSSVRAPANAPGRLEPTAKSS